MRPISFFCGFIFLFLTMTAWGDPSQDAYNSGVQLYQQGKYDQAIASLKEAVRLDPQSWQAYQLLAYSCNQVGDRDGAIDAIRSSLSIHPDNHDLQKWAAQLGYQPPPAALSGITPPPIKDITFFKTVDIRIAFDWAMLTLGDFKNNSGYYQNLHLFFRNEGDTFTPHYGNVPGNILPQVDLEASIRVNPELEGGLFFSYLPVGTVNNLLLDYYASGTAATLSLQDSYSITAIEAGFQGRYTFAHGNFRPFLSGGVMAVPMWINYGMKDTYIDYATTGLENESLNESFAALGFGAQVQAGFDWDLGKGFALSPSVGYQVISASHFEATAPDGGRSNLDVVQTDFGAAIAPIENGNLQRVVYQSINNALYAGTPAPNSTPMVLDLSGLKAGIQISYTF